MTLNKIIKYTVASMALLVMLPVIAYEDCIVTTNGKLTDIKIQHNDIIDVFPLITVMNDKNTLIVHPLKTGETKFTVMKNNKDKYLFSVKVSEDKTEIEDVQGFEVMTIDCPPGGYEYYFDLDEPPFDDDKTEIGETFIDSLDEPPVLRGE